MSRDDFDWTSYATQWKNGQKSSGKKQKPIFTTKPKGRFSGSCLLFLGLLLCCLIGVTGAILGVLTLFSSIYLDKPVLILLGILFAIGAYFLLRGRRIQNRIKRFDLYRKNLLGKEYCELSLLGKATGKSVRYLRRDLQKMISLGMFPQAHLDESENCLILTDSSYEQYRMMMRAKEQQKKDEQEEARKREAEEQRKQEEENQRFADVDQEKREEIVKMIREGEAYLERFDQIGKRLVGQEMNRKLSRLSLVTGRIFDFITEHPKKTSDIRKFLSYYLPTTEKLLNTYEELDREPVQGENITKAKKEIMDTLDTINYAFENLLDSLYEDTAMDVSTDIAVLETMLAQEGLVEKEDAGWKTF
jgi:5-bromo-4-chloroindolyl phosphate hydrolysis protein